MEEYETYQPPEGEMPYDVFYHFAWGGTTGDGRNDCEIQEKNIRYALDAAALAKRFGCSAFVGAGSQAEYGRVEGNLNSQTPAFPENGYGMAKLCAGQMTRLYCRQAGMRHVWTRILSIYGPGDGAGPDGDARTIAQAFGRRDPGIYKRRAAVGLPVQWRCRESPASPWRKRP